MCSVPFTPLDTFTNLARNKAAQAAQPHHTCRVQKDDTKANFWQVVPKGPDVAANPHPDRDAVQNAMASTMDALSRVVDTKLTAANPKALSTGTKPGGPQYIKYTPQATNRHHNSGVDQRIIQMQEMPVDPLEPPKFRHTKVPKVPDDTPVPVLHSPPRPVTKEDQVNWKIPPCVSAWKNAKARSQCICSLFFVCFQPRRAGHFRGARKAAIRRHTPPPFPVLSARLTTTA